MENLVVVALLPAALAIVMFGLGLSLVAQDFRRVITMPRAALIALTIQILVLPALCFGLVTLLGLSGELAVGMMLLAAAPGGTTANIFSHFSGGDVALNVTLTAINSVTSVLTLPIIVNMSITHFLNEEDRVGLHFTETLRVVVIVLIPVLIGMTVRRRREELARRLARPMERASAVILTVVILLALVGNLDILGEHILSVGTAAVLLCCLSLVIGYWVPKLAGVPRPQAVASSFEVGVHNATIAVLVALSVLDNDQMSVAPAIYGVVMYAPAVTAYLIFRRSAPEDIQDARAEANVVEHP